jgi:putative ABC transport system ATP-binding protein
MPAPLEHSPGGLIADLTKIEKIYYKADGSVLVEALRGVDIAIQAGEYVALMGPSGSGKSTMMNILGCLDRPTRCRYLLDGLDVAQMDDETRSHFRGKKIGFVFQAFNLISALTILENVEVPLFYQGVHRHERQKRAAEKLELVGLADRMGHRPTELSGGQQQRAAIARSLVCDPSIIMADEPTGNLDTKTGDAILEVLQNLHIAGMTIIIVTHDEEVVHRCERVIRLRDGLLESDQVLCRRGVLRPSHTNGSGMKH